MADKKFSVTGDQFICADAKMSEIKCQLRLGLSLSAKNESPLDPELVNEALQDIVEGRFHNRVENNILACISGDERVMIDAVDGSETLGDAKDVFAAIDSDFVNWGINKKGRATPETPVSVYEMRKDATFA